MGRVDREVVGQRIERMLFEVEQIERRLPGTCEEYVAAEFDDRRYELEHRLYIALQAMLDTAAHIAVSQDVRNLMTARDAITAMGRLGIADRSLVERLEGAVGLRNALVHEYLVLDDERVYRAMCSVDDLRAFAAAVWGWVGRG